jgi:predicted RNA-binding protein YlxR (DUF448 family)
MSRKGHVAIRMCFGCLKKRKKREMIRFIQSSDKLVIMDAKRNLPGRGFYLCADAACFKKAQKKIDGQSPWNRWINDIFHQGYSLWMKFS